MQIDNGRRGSNAQLKYAWSGETCLGEISTAESQKIMWLLQLCATCRVVVLYAKISLKVQCSFCFCDGCGPDYAHK